MSTGNSNDEKIKELLGSGLSNEVVASAVGVHPSHISQLMSVDSFRDEVVAKRTMTLTAASSRDRNIDSLEDKLIQKLHDTIDWITSPKEQLRAFAVINAAKRRGNPASDNLVVNQQIITLNLPAVVTHNYVKNAFQEVIEVEGQTLVTMPASALMKQLAEKGGRKDYEQIRRFLPSNNGNEVKEG